MRQRKDEKEKCFYFSSEAVTRDVHGKSSKERTEDKCNDGEKENLYFYILVFIIIHPVSSIGKKLAANDS